jgi:diguanylate cyclase (GGDEF)-like protein/PAS domain S-box-containing protein
MVNAIRFLPTPPAENLLYIGSYEPLWVVVSIILAILASYAALKAAARIDPRHDTTTKLLWTLIAAFTLGIGVWAMHFIGMTALILPCRARYDPLITIISMIPAVLASGVALGIGWNQNTKHLPLIFSSILLGAGIGTMHYTGMSAMNLDGFVRYDPTWFALSIVVAVGLSYLALRVKNGAAGLMKYGDVLVAVILGSAVSGMHYTAMFAAYFVRGDVGAMPPSLFTTNEIASLVALITAFLALGALALSAISRNREMADELRIAATSFETQEGILITDADNTILRVNHAFTKITGYSPGEVIGRNPGILKSGRHDMNFYTAMWNEIMHAGVWDGEIWNRHKNGDAYLEHLIITAVKNKSGTVTNYVATITDFTMSTEVANRINYLAFYDPLTELPNRLLLMDRLQRALNSSQRSGRSGALVFLDLDQFKTLNDTLGHDIGDLLLQQVAQRLTALVREGDTVARLGGDEFVVILEMLSEFAQEAAEQAETISKKIQAALNQPYQLAAHQYRNTPSIGVTLFHGHQTSAENLMKQADIAMYQAKQAGRNTMRFFDPKMQEIINAHAALEHDLRQAIEQQQFQLHYQIQVEGMNRAFGAEALIRWNHPLRGMVPPAEFIPFAEETKLILPIGLWVLEGACAQLKAWEQNESTRDLILAVNVSANQFHQADFVNQVQAAIQHHAINPARLKLELTEGILLASIEDTIVTMNTLNKLGVRFSLDDFGTGYSSLQYLKLLPLDQIKIDQSFVRDIATDPNDAAIVQTIIAMADALGLNVIAEGVETEMQREFLELRGCTHYQGYLFGKPLPITEFHALLKEIDYRRHAES